MEDKSESEVEPDSGSESTWNSEWETDGESESWRSGGSEIEGEIEGVNEWVKGGDDLGGYCEREWGGERRENEGETEEVTERMSEGESGGEAEEQTEGVLKQHSPYTKFLPADPDSEECYEKISSCLSECLEEHQQCASMATSYVPTRLLAVGDGSSENEDTVRLVIPAEDGTAVNK
jgi:hypothetical protein